MDDLITLEGVIENVTHQNTENGFTVFEFSSGGEYITATGILSRVFIGEKYTFCGRWETHSVYGKQFRVDSAVGSVPETAEEMFSFLASGIIKGVGEKTAHKIIAMFGDRSFEIIENEPSRLAKINGISPGKAVQISQQFAKLNAERTEIISLEKLGLNTNEAMRVFKKFGGRSSGIVERNPYQLCNSDVGIDFERADSIASGFSTRPSDEYRFTEGTIYIVRQNIYRNGHTCIPRKKLVRTCMDYLGCSEDDAEINIDRALENKRLVADKVFAKEMVFLPEMYEAERGAAEQLIFISRYAGKSFDDIDEQIRSSEVLGGVVYNDLQRRAVRTAVEKGILILTGGPGTGKTTTIRGILRVFEALGLEVALAAPTGRAAKRMTELTGKEAVTIHRLLEVEWDEEDRPVFKRNKRNPLTAQAVIVDELSMVDSRLFYDLLDALPIGCRLIMVGDSDQLPPVGAGNVLHDMIGSQRLPVIELNEVFRQAMESMIITNAHAIVAGEMPDLSRSDKDFFFINRQYPEAACETVCELCAERLPKAYNYSAFDDIQVLCPSKKGETGTGNINKLLQAKLNPAAKGKKEHVFGTRTFRIGDKLMQTKNNYNIEWKSDEREGQGIFNGDIGILEEIDENELVLKVRFDDRLASIPFECSADLDFAYAVTVHKSQGSEFNAVVIPVTGISPYLQYRNLLYTAVTRAKELIILVGRADTIGKMVNNNKKQSRYSALKYYIMLGDKS